jgi:hypothetical protein
MSKKIHPEHKSVINGAKYVLCRNEYGAKCLVPYKEAKHKKLIKGVWWSWPGNHYK